MQPDAWHTVNQDVHALTQKSSSILPTTSLKYIKICLSLEKGGFMSSCEVKTKIKALRHFKVKAV